MKYYFKSKDAERCYSLTAIKQEMKEEGIKQITVFEAKIVNDIPIFHCKKFDECYEKREGCGKECFCYEPRNGIKGCCIHYGFCYENTGIEKLIKI